MLFLRVHRELWPATRINASQTRWLEERCCNLNARAISQTALITFGAEFIIQSQIPEDWLQWRPT